MAETITMPKLGFDMQEGTLVRWLKNEGENINKGDVLAEIETDKATVEVESSASGVIRKLMVDQGSVVPIGAPIAVVGSKDKKIEDTIQPTKVETKSTSSTPATKPGASSSTATQAPSIVAPVTPAELAPSSGLVKASPLARKLARDSRVDLSHVQGSGPGGRIVRRDIEVALSGGTMNIPSVSEAIPSFVPVSHADENVARSKLRQAIARRMTESKTSIPHFYVTHEYKVDALLDLRKQANAYLPDDQKISVNDFVVKAAALVLREFPNLNSALQGDQLLKHGAVNMGVAVAVPGGLMTVVCRDADQKPLRQIAYELKSLAGRAREGKVKPDDIEGSTFTVSNLGMFDVEEFIAIINPPEAAILAIGSAREVPVVENGELKVGWRMKATVSVDHRVSDGAEAAQFMQALARFLENPVKMLL